MIKTLIKYAKGEIYQVKQTSKSIYLSDGTHWNSRNFHQSLGLVKAFMYREISTDPEIQALDAQIKAMKEDAIARRDFTIEQLATAAVRQTDDLNPMVRQDGRKAFIDLRKQANTPVEVTRVTAVPEPAKEPIGSDSLTNAMRYIILQHWETEEYRFYFAKAYTGHYELEHEYQELHGRDWKAKGGGFYCAALGNAYTSLNAYWESEWKEMPYRGSLVLFGKSDTFGLPREVLRDALPALKDRLKGIDVNIIDVAFQFSPDESQ